MTESTYGLPNDPATTLNTISQDIHETLVAIQQQHPEWLAEKYRQKPWHLPNYQTAFVQKMTQGLSQTKTTTELLQKVHQYLELFFSPESINSPEITLLWRKINQYFAVSAHPIPKRQTNASGIAILLLDAENLQLDSNTEKFLDTICHYPLQIKVAFANWRSLGKQDIDYHERGYQLIHVPAGKDSADLKLATVGASIFVHYPTAQEIFICSSDQALTHLRNTLQSHGLNVYQVQKHQEQLTVLNFQTGQLHHYSLLNNPEVPTLDQLIEQIKELIRLEQTQQISAWVQLSRISSIYKSRYHLALTQLVSLYFPGNHLKDFFLQNPAEFAIHRVSENSEIYITLFDNQFIEPTPIKALPIFAPPSPLLSQQDLEKYLLKILSALTQGLPQKYLPIAHLASEFNHQYGQPVTQVIKQLQIRYKFPKFLESSPGFKVKKVKGIWMVSLND